MTALTTEQFKNHFQIKGKTAILSPQVAMIASLCGHTDFDYHPPSEISEPTDQYDTVLVDILDQDRFPNSNSSHSFRWFKYSLKFLKFNSILIGKFPISVLSKLSEISKQSYHLNRIIINDNYCFLEVIKSFKNNLTEVIYESGEKIQIDISKFMILHHYDSEIYNYIFKYSKIKEYKRVTFSGSKVSDKIKTLKNETKNQNKYGLVIYSNIPKLRVEKLENTNVTSGSDCYLFDSEEERNSYFDVLKNKKVIALAKNLSYNQTINVKVQSYLVTPQIFEYAS